MKSSFGKFGANYINRIMSDVVMAKGAPVMVVFMFVAVFLFVLSSTLAAAAGKAEASVSVESTAVESISVGPTYEGSSHLPKMYLHGGWKLARVPDVAASVEECSLASFKVDGSVWIDAVVPGTALLAYEKAGKIPDPYFGLNMQKISQKHYNVDYWYRSTFVVPEGFKGKSLWINFDGINWRAEVYINGSYVGRIDGPFIRGKFDITPVVKYGEENAIAVKIIWCEATERDTPTFICVNSWDFMPAIPGRNVGIYKAVYLSATGDVTIVDPFIKTDLPLPNTDYADISVELGLRNHSGARVEGRLRGVIDPGGITFEDLVVIDGDSEVVKSYTSSDFPQLRIENPKLWWPNGMGEQNLYTIRFTFEQLAGSDGDYGDSVRAISAEFIPSDLKTISFGIREYGYSTPDGSDLVISVNGRRVFVRGGNWGIPDAMLKWGEKEFDLAVRLHKELNFNMIRTWHGTSDFDAFYDACDRYGIMVFEDFWLNGPHYPNDVDMFMANVEDKFKRLRNRASIALWCGENEAIPPYDLQYRLPEAYERLDGTRMYIQASNIFPVSGGISYGIEDPSWYFKVSKGFVTELGAVTVPVIESMRRMIPEDKLWPVGNEYWEFHDFDFDIGNKQLDRYKASVSGRYGEVKNIVDFCRKAQLINYETYRAIFEGFNDKMWDGTSGVLLWMSQPAWPSTIWQIYDYYFEPTGGYFGSKLACEPVHVQWNSHTGNVKVINTTNEEFRDATVKASIYNLNGKLAAERVAKVDISPDSAVSCFDLFDSIGENLAVGKRVTASSYDGSYLPENVVDGDAKSRWAAKGRGKEWIEIDLGDVFDVDNVVITWEAAFAKEYMVMVSANRTAWKNVYRDTRGNGGISSIRFKPVQARYVRVQCTSPGTMWSYSIYDIAVNRAGTTDPGPEGLSKVHFIKLSLTDADGRLLSENTYWRSQEGYDYSDMEKMPKIRLNVTAKLVEMENVEKNTAATQSTLVTVTVHNTTSTPAVGIRVKAVDAASGENLLPVIYSDNYFTLMQGESKEITVELPTSDADGAAIVIEGLNVPESRVKL